MATLKKKGGVSSTFRDSKTAPFMWREQLTMAEVSTEMMKKTNETRLTLSSLGGEDSRRLHRSDAPLGLRKVYQISQILLKRKLIKTFFQS